MNLSQAKYSSLVHSTRQKVLFSLNAMWGRLPSYRDADIDRFLARVVPLVQAGQLTISGATASYLGSKLDVATTVDRNDILFARGVDPYEVYRRPAVTTYTKLAEGGSMSMAVEAGAARLLSIASMDMQLAKTHQARDTFSRTNVTYFRRVLTGRENCALCVIASTQRYNRGDLLPIHPGCDCDVDTIPKGSIDTGNVLDQELLDRTHDEIALHLGRSENRARDLGLDKQNVRGDRLSDYTDLIVTREHGEYGPTLAWRDHKFTSEEQILALA